MVAILGVLALVFVAACGSSDSTDSNAPSPSVTDTVAAGAGKDQKFPDVEQVVATNDGATWNFDVTISSPYDTPERYADGWRVTGPDGKVYGEHELGHDHASEQPFTRSQTGVEIPEDVDTVTVEGRDKANGYGGATKQVDLAAAR